MKLYNTLTQAKEIFTPLQEKKVGMYHCGPTVYDYVHIGNLRSFLLADYLRRSFEYLGYEVTQVMNITDVGHLVSDADDGEDKMSKGLRREGKEINLSNMLELAETYNQAFQRNLKELHILTPQHLPKASDHIQEDINIIKQLEAKGYTYTTSDAIYFDTQQMPEYGKLGGISLDNEGQSRIGENTEKKHQADFALWKFDQNQGWDSPWGQGFPGWHIECSGMSMKYLGEHFDIHTGGIDNRDIHHNNEIAQSECATGHSFVNYWLHGEMLTWQGEKLSKSTGGNITLETLKEKGFSPLHYRYLALQTHYRSKMNFSWDILQAAKTSLDRIYQQILELKKYEGGTIDSSFKEQFIQKISDDINLPQALALLHELIKSDLDKADIYATLIDFDQVLGLDLANYQENQEELPEAITALAEQRKKAREVHDWAASDRIREEIQAEGYDVQDVQGEQKLRKK